MSCHCTHTVRQEVVIVQHMGIPLLEGKSQGWWAIAGPVPGSLNSLEVCQQ